MSKQPPYILKFILLISLLFGMFKLSAQHYPVQANVQVIPPYSVRLSDYYKANNQKLLVTIILKDLQRTDLSVRLRIRIKGQGIEMVTKDDFIPKQQIILQPGAPEMIYGDRLEEYLSPNHMNFSGITKSEFIKTGRLPEGVYQFSVEVLEMRRKEKLSNTAKAMAWLIMNEPPKITSPINNKLVKASDPASIFFTWLPRHMNSQNALSDVMYEFTMVEIWPLNQSAEEAIRSKEPIVKENFNITSFVYDARYPMLEPGRKYACRVRAYSQENQEMFKNDGYSQVVCFTFGQECKVPQGFTVEPPENGSVRLSVIPENNHSSYVVHVRDLSGNKWYGQEHNSSEFQVNQLRIGSSYECKVQAQCGSFSSRFTPIRQFTLNEEIPQKVECGKGGDVPQIDNSDPLYELKVGDKVNAGGFEVIIKEVTGSGNFSGKGVVRIGMLGNIELRTVFDDIQVNESYQLTAGEIKIVGSDIYVLTGDVRDKANEVFENEKWKDIDQAIANAEEFSNLVKDFQKEVEDVKLNQELNEARELIEKGRTLLAKEDKQGAELVKQGSDKVNAILDKINSGEYKITSNGIEFIAHNQQRYGFDNIDNELTDAEQKAYRSYYKVAEVGDTSKLSYYTKPWKSIGSYQTDQVSMKISLQEGMSVDTLHFVNKIGVQITPQKQGDNYTLLLQGKGHEEVEQITAYYNVVDDSSKRKRPISVAALNVISYDQIDKTVVLVPVNGNKTKPSIFSLQAYLNSIYKSANVKWQVEMHPGIQVEYNNDMSKGIDDGAAGILSNYTKEMNKVIQALKRSNDFDRHKKYLLFIDKSKTVNKQGFMPKKRPYGFIFTDYNRSDKQLNRTIAHELGHGIFRLTHNFDDFASLTKGSTQNLMDYAGGTQLRKFQWNDIHNLREVKWWGQDKKQNAAFGEKGTDWFCVGNDDVMKQINKDFQKFFIPDGRVVDLKEKLVASGFFSLKDQSKGTPGSISNIRVGDYDYKHHFVPKDSAQTENITDGYGFTFTDNKKLGGTIKVDKYITEDTVGVARVYQDLSSKGDQQLKVVCNGKIKIYPIATNYTCHYREISECDFLWGKIASDSTARGHEFTNPNNYFYAIVKADPCMLKNLTNNPFYGVEIEGWSELEGQFFKVVFVGGLSVFMLPVVVEMGSATIANLGKEALKKMVKDRMKEMLNDALIQLSINTLINTLMSEGELSEKDYLAIMKKSIEDINWIDVAMAPVANKVGKSMGNKGVVLSASWGCVSSFFDKIEFEGVKPVIKNTDGWEVGKDCLVGAFCESLSYLVSTNASARPAWANKVFRSLGQIKNKIKENPAKFFTLCRMLNIKLGNLEPAKKLLKVIGFDEQEATNILMRFCLPAGTPIYANGQFFKKVEQIQVGDSIDAMDAHGKIQLHKVLHLFRNESQQLAYVYANGKELIALTPNHSVYTPSQWKRARDLIEGDSLLQLPNKFLVVDSVTIRNQVQPVYNFEVDKAHNYFAGNAAILTHNKNCGGINELLAGSYKNLANRFGDHLSILKDALKDIKGEKLIDILNELKKLGKKELDAFVQTLVSKYDFAKALLSDTNLLKAWRLLVDRPYIRNHIEYLENITTAFTALPSRVDKIKAAIKDPQLKKGLKNLLEALGDPDIIKDNASFDKFLKELSSLKKYADFDVNFDLNLGNKVDGLIKVASDHLPFGELKKTSDLRQELRNKCKKLKIGSPDYKKEMKKIVDYSEEIAEKRAEQIIKNKYPNVTDLTDDLRPNNKGKQRQFDKVFRDEDSGRIIIIEAKGGSSILGAANGNQQGTDKYFEELVDYLKEKSGISKKLIRQLEKAREDDLLDYLLVKQKFNVETGDLLPTEIQKFEL